MERWEWEEEQDRREAETIRRLYRLKKRGYEIDWRVQEVEDAFFLNHLGEGPDLLFYPSGMVVSYSSEITINLAAGEDDDRILNRSKNDIAQFDRWLASVSPPTWWQRGAPDREKYLYIPAFWVAFIGLSFALGQFLEWLYKPVFG